MNDFLNRFDSPIPTTFGKKVDKYKFIGVDLASKPDQTKHWVYDSRAVGLDELAKGCTEEAPVSVKAWSKLSSPINGRIAGAALAWGVSWWPDGKYVVIQEMLRPQRVIEPGTSYHTNGMTINNPR